MNLLEKMASHLSGKGIGFIPGAGSLFFFLYQHFGPNGIGLVRAEGLEFYIDRSDHGAIPFILRGCWEPRTTEIFKSVVKEGMTVLDMGAHVGYYTLIAASLVGTKGHVYAFEPVPDTFNLLERNINKYEYKNVTLINKAVADSDGIHRFYVDIKHNAMRSTLSEFYHVPNYINVLTISLDNFLGDTEVDVIKMDIEGSEMLALKGMRKIIERSPNLKIITEANPGFLEGCGSSLEEYMQELLKYFDVTIIMDGQRHGEWGLVPYSSPDQVIGLASLPRIGGGINLYCERKVK